MAAGSFFTEIQETAQWAARKTGLDPAVIMAQWAHESTFGGSYGARHRNNLSGISWGSTKIPSWSKATKVEPRPKNEGGYYFVYDSVADFASDYAHVMNNSRYNHVREAGTVSGQIKALATPSPVDGKTFAGDSYGGDGKSLLAIVKQYGLSSDPGVEKAIGQTPAKQTKTETVTQAQTGQDGFFNLNPSGWMETTGEWVQSAGFVLIGLPFLIFGIWFLFGGGGSVIEITKEALTNESE